jgi:hypothetical protein
MLRGNEGENLLDGAPDALPFVKRRNDNAVTRQNGALWIVQSMWTGLLCGSQIWPSWLDSIRL